MTYLKRVEDVLGPDWDKQTEGQKLKEEGEAFKKKLNTQELFEDWKLKVFMIIYALKVLCLMFAGGGTATSSDREDI